MRIYNGLGHPIWYQGSKLVLIQAGESEVPDEIVVELGKAEGQIKDWMAAGLLKITSIEPSETDTIDEKPKAKKKG